MCQALEGSDELWPRPPIRLGTRDLPASQCQLRLWVLSLTLGLLWGLAQPIIGPESEGQCCDRDR